ncbi:MAG: TatD family hydrolase [Alphaproteobacteria bacterium]|nr:TatD family hydrolase [Alphaproteobacteria bacterium]
MFLIDSHCHLDYEPLSNDIEGTLKRAGEVNVRGFLTICTDLTKIPVLTRIAEEHSEVFASLGVHPHEAQHVMPDKDFYKLLVEEAKHPKMVGFGETGLDYYYKHSSPEDQKRSYKIHIEAAVESDLPLIIHTRDAEADTIELLKTVGRGRARGLIHCFTGSAWLRDQALDLGFYISVSGIITFKNAEALRDILKEVPLEKLLVETDSPFLAPEPYRGKPNEPAFVVETAKKLAEIKKVPFEMISDCTSHNFLTLFSKVRLPCV